MSEGEGDDLGGRKEGKVGKREGVKVTPIPEWLPGCGTCYVMISSRVFSTVRCRYDNFSK